MDLRYRTPLQRVEDDLTQRRRCVAVLRRRVSTAGSGFHRAVLPAELSGADALYERAGEALRIARDCLAQAHHRLRTMTARDPSLRDWMGKDDPTAPRDVTELPCSEVDASLATPD